MSQPAFEFSANARRILNARYLQPGETPDGMLRRVSFGVDEYYRLMADGLFLPNSPTLFNAGVKTTKPGTLSACFVFDVADNLLDPDGILDTERKAAAVAKAGGGVGYYFGHLRPKGAEVNSTHRRACGPVAVIRRFHTLRNLITQGGKRDLAQMGVLPCHHADIFEFVHCKDADPKALESFNLSVSWTDDWLERVDFDWLRDHWQEDITPNDATRLWKEQCESAWATGCPGMLFDGTINRAHPTPHLGRINAPNPCGETPNQSDEPCNLGSQNLARFWTGRRADARPPAEAVAACVDLAALERSTRTCVRFLDRILDENVFPHPAIDRQARLTRKLGLGVMGWADLLALCHVHYDTDMAVEMGREVERLIDGWALDESVRLGAETGVYPGYDPERSPAWAPAARNSTRTSQAPTGTIAGLLGASYGIEPHFALENTRVTNEGMVLTERIPVLDRLDGFVPKTANRIGLEWHVRHQAAFQQHTDLGVSKTINMPESATVNDVSDAYRLMWKLGCKGGTVYRNNCRPEQVLRDTGKRPASVYAAAEPPPPAAASARTPMPATRAGVTHKARIGGVKVYLTANRDAAGRVRELFIRAGKQGTPVNGMLDTWAVTLSTALQHGVPAAALVKTLAGLEFAPNGPTGNPVLPTCTSVPDYAVRWLAALDDPAPAAADAAGSGHYCPECGKELLRQAGCLSCPPGGCGYSRC